MDSIKDAFGKVKADIDALRSEIAILSVQMQDILKEIFEIRDSSVPTQNWQNTTIPTHIPTNQQFFKPLKPQILPISIGNRGVPTNQQTNKPTNQHIPESQNIIDSAAEILDSLDNAKREIRLKFKRLTEQEFLVFSTLYSLDEQTPYVEYKDIAGRLGLTEASIRDYVGKLIKKGIPVEKQRVNNKIIRLSISPNLKKVATLQTILQLRGI